jgi:hypothetical protein
VWIKAAHRDDHSDVSPLREVTLLTYSTYLLPQGRQ